MTDATGEQLSNWLLRPYSGCSNKAMTYAHPRNGCFWQVTVLCQQDDSCDTALTRPTFDVTLPTRVPGLPISLFFSSCWTTSSGPMVFARYVNIMSSAVTVSRLTLFPYTPALLMTTWYTTGACSLCCHEKLKSVYVCTSLHYDQIGKTYICISIYMCIYTYIYT